MWSIQMKPLSSEVSTLIGKAHDMIRNQWISDPSEQMQWTFPKLPGAE